MSQSLTIARRFNGPVDSGNGGYVGGQLAKALGGIVAVSLHLPPPLDMPLMISREDGQAFLKLEDGTLVAQAESASVEIDVPSCPSCEAVVAAQPNYAGFNFHALPTCFVCGPDRAAGDGLRVFASPVGKGELVAAPWTPHGDLAEGGVVKPEFIWAALDCPGYFAVINAMGSKGEKILTARMAVDQVAPVHAGEHHIITGWQIRSEGRKHWAGTALFDAHGNLKATSEALWIKPRAVA
jgi:hypothetical protein